MNDDLIPATGPGRPKDLEKKKAILEAGRLCDFSWRFTTFEFNDDSFAERFRALNETKLTEVTA